MQPQPLQEKPTDQQETSRMKTWSKPVIWQLIDEDTSGKPENFWGEGTQILPSYKVYGPS